MRNSSSDRVLYCSGQGSIGTLLQQAAKLLADDDLAVGSHWENVLGVDHGASVAYHCYKPAVAALAVAPQSSMFDIKSNIDLDEVRCETNALGPSN